MKYLKLNTFNLLALGLLIFFGGTLLAAAGAGTLLWLLVRFVAAVLFFFAAWIGFVRHNMPPVGRRYFKLYVGLLAYVTVLTLPNLAGTWGYLGYRAALAGDVITYGLFAFGLALFALSGSQVIAIFKLLLALCFGLFVVLIPLLDPSAVGAAGSRNDALSVAGLGESRHVYHFQMGMAVIFPYLLLSGFAIPLHAIWRAVLYITPAFVLMISLYYSKRSLLLDLLVCMALLYGVVAMFSTHFAGLKKFKLLGITALLGVLLVLAGITFGKNLHVVTERLTGRFDELTESLGEVDRVVEAQNYWYLVGPIRRVTGAGSMYFHQASTELPKGTLHIGWFNLYHKGGPPFVLFVAYIFFTNFVQAFRFRRRPSFAVGATLPIMCAISLMHSTVFGSLHGTFAFVLALFLYPVLFSLESNGGLPGAHAGHAGQPQRPHPAGFRRRF